METERDRRQYALLVGCLLLTAVVYLVLVPRLVLDGQDSRAVLYLVIGWVPYTCTFYTAGRLFSSPERLPNMRGADAGLALVLVLVLLSLGLDAWGFTPEQVPIVHAPLAAGIFLGLALFGWGLGRRSSAIATKTS
ncbi:hypothetical protein ACLI4Z_08900 [Natrialbaceae archaeon A-arb3/5]